MDPVLTLTDAPSDDAWAVIDGGLSAYNKEQAGYVDGRPLAMLVSDPATGKVVGGLLGRTSLGLLFIDLFYLPAALRGHGLGDRIMRAVEDEARTRGCQKAVVYTISFQAPAFYERHGYKVFGRIDLPPPGASRIFLSKDL
jgi:GNAT superfamily N-acetyltransferase